MLGWLRRWRKPKTDSPAPTNTTPDAASPPVKPSPPRAPQPAAPAIPASEPLIIPRPEHTLSRRDISVNTLKVMGRLIQHGYKAYLVGGGIRDVLIHKRPKDFDVVTDAKPEQVRALFRNSRLIGRRFRLVHVFFRDGEIIEVSTFRRGVDFDVESDGPVQEENTFGTPAEDAHRRDLTINALYYDLQNFAIYDYVGGMADLKNGVIRVIGDPVTRFHEDPIRMMRAVRHSAGTGFAIEPRTREAIRECAAEIAKVNPSRRRDEFLRELVEGRSRKSLEIMLDLGLLGRIMPTIRRVFGDDGGRPEVREHFFRNLAAVDEAIARGKEVPFPVILAALMSPLVAAQNFPAQVEDPRRLRGFLSAAVRSFVKPILAEIGVSKANAEAAALLLAGQSQLERAISYGPQIPKHILRKSYFVPGLMLYQIERRHTGERLPKPLFQAGLDQNALLFVEASPNKKRRRPHRSRNRTARAKTGTPETPAAAPAEQPPKNQPPASPPDDSLRFKHSE
ncbi:MAG: polynucleotide adenylyltransferase PcnB [Myxococcales bacterium]|nr:polynucleotide adenylyltransferase PcnB [Myxococcales bacterium]